MITATPEIIRAANRIALMRAARCGYAGNFPQPLDSSFEQAHGGAVTLQPLNF